MTTQADALRMADKLEQVVGVDHEDQIVCDEAAAMLREYAERMRVDEAMVKRAESAYLISIYSAPSLQNNTAGMREAMRAALTAALSGREEIEDLIQDPEPLCTVCGDHGCAACGDVK